MLGVPTIWKLLMDAPQFTSADLSHVRWFISGGAPLPEYIAAAYQARGVVFKQSYCQQALCSPSRISMAMP